MAQIIPISDFSAPELDVYARLTEAQLLNRHCLTQGLFIAESPKVIGRALDAGCVPVSFLAEDRHMEGEARQVLDRCGDIPAYCAPFQVLTQLTGYQLTRGMLCAMRRPPLPALTEVLSGARRVAVLEDVMNPTNVGAIFRSAAALGQGLQQSPVPPICPGEHGHRVPDPLDIPGGKLAAAASRCRLQDRRHGPLR